LTPTNTGTSYDLLANWKTTSGINLTLPGITIGRVLIKISITITVPAAVAAADGVFVAIGVQDQTLVAAGSVNANNPVAQPFDIQYMWWENVYRTESIVAGEPAATTQSLFRAIDIRSKRKLTAPGQSLGLTLLGTGGTTAFTFSATGQALLYMP